VSYIPAGKQLQLKAKLEGNRVNIECRQVTTFFFFFYQPQTMNIVDMAIHLVICQKTDFHGNSDFQNSPNSPFKNTQKI
jgi:hypothetical protein